MAPREDIQKILNLAVQAPSGDNAQPWRFVVHGEVINLFNVPGKDHSPYNFRERGSLFANGALVENAIIAASLLGYAIDVRLFPTPSDANHVASLELRAEPEKHQADSLAAYLESRATNRKPYQKKALADQHKLELQKVFMEMNFGELLLLEDQKDIQKFAKTVSISDQLIFEEKSIHDAIFSSIRWTEAEEKKQRGMYVKTLELPPPALGLFKILKNWSALTFMNKFKISKFIASQSAKVFASSSAIGMIIIPNTENESYVKIGRTFERFWLKATELGLSIQPVTALAYLAERIVAGDAGELTAAHSAAITQAQKNILALFGEPKGVVAMMFRIGYGGQPSAHSRKTEPEIHYAA